VRRVILVVLAAAVVSALASLSALADAAYTDPAGDATGDAPDITGVRVSNDTGGQILFSVAVSNLTPESMLWLTLDTDNNKATGKDGSDYVLSWTASANPAQNGWYIQRWDGTNWAPSSYASLRSELTPSGVDFSVNQSDLGNTTGFALKAIAERFLGSAVSGIDLAPDGLSSWRYALTPGATPVLTPPVTAVKPVFGAISTVPARPLAGKTLLVTLAVNRSDTGTPLTIGTITSEPSIAGIVLQHAQSFSNGKARLSFVVPKTARGKVITVKIKITSGAQSATKVATFKVR
jgi:hypothetical protein